VSPAQRGARCYMLRQATPRLTTEEIATLVHAAQAGDMTARDRLVLANLALVHHWANDFAKRSRADRADLVQEGTLGLLRAIESYEPAAAAFGTYASWWIRYYVRIAVRDARSLVLARSRRNGTWQEIAADTYTDGQAGYVQEALSTVGSTVSCSVVAPLPDELAERRQLATTVRARATAEAREPRERDLLSHRLMGDGSETLVTVGARYNQTRANLSLVEIALKKRLRVALRPCKRAAMELNLIGLGARP
jgi:RNA polymerase sigma factor (sigma-70 family)